MPWRIASVELKSSDALFFAPAVPAPAAFRLPGGRPPRFRRWAVPPAGSAPLPASFPASTGSIGFALPSLPAALDEPLSPGCSPPFAPRIRLTSLDRIPVHWPPPPRHRRSSPRLGQSPAQPLPARCVLRQPPVRPLPQPSFRPPLPPERQRAFPLPLLRLHPCSDLSQRNESGLTRRAISAKARERPANFCRMLATSIVMSASWRA